MSSKHIQFKLKLDSLIKKHGITQKTIATLTGLRPSTLSAYVNNDRRSIDFAILSKLMLFFEITDLNELIEVFVYESNEMLPIESDGDIDVDYDSVFVTLSEYLDNRDYYDKLMHDASTVRIRKPN